MTPASIELLKTELRRDEGERLEIYKDHLGFPTVGIGHLIVEADPEHGKPVGTKITKARSEALFEHDVGRTLDGLTRAIPWITEQPEQVQRALVNMAFQMGVQGVVKFKNTLMYIRRKDYATAYTNALQSLWAKQTPARANRVLTLIRTAPR